MSHSLFPQTMSSTFKHIKPNSADHHPPLTTTTTTTHHHHTLVKEHMFEKRLTPSDVGKLNRLVIPKHFAEKYLPLVSTSTATASSLLLSFTDESGKPWKFRYSYWNSSQSYVLTKGWTRFVKEKKLNAGDVVLFQRQVVNGRSTAIMFLGWRRRSNGGRSVSSVHTDTEIKRDVKCKTLRLFGVNVECTTHEPEEFIRHRHHHHHHQC